MSDRVQVFIRVRPRIKGGNALHSSEWHHPDAVNRNGENNIVIAESRSTAAGDYDVKSQEFVFDGILDQDSTQEEVYEYAALDAMDAVTSAQGNGITIFCYGQSGSGKSWTILGQINEEKSNKKGAVATAAAEPIISSSSPICTESGLLLRALQDLLAYQKNQRQQGLFQIVITLNVVEVYLDTVRDLLAKDPGEPLKVVIVDDGVQIPDLTYREVASLQDALKAYNDASRRRVSRATDANDSSSRSHAIFNIDVFRIPLVSLASLTAGNSNPSVGGAKKEFGDDGGGGGESGGDSRSATPTSPASPAGGKPRIIPTANDIIAARNLRKQTAVPTSVQNCGLFPSANIMMVRPSSATTSSNAVAPSLVPVFHSRVGLVDLAGSEKMKSVNSKGEALEEMKKINGSLTALGNVVHSLHTNSKHVPYRDSRLTVLLRDGFASPGARIVLIANIAPTSVCRDESMSTLLFANKVKAMKADRNAGASGSAAELALQASLTEVLKKFDAFACDLRIWSAGFSPTEDRTKALRMLRDQHLDNKKSGGSLMSAAEEQDRIGASVRAMAEDAKAQRVAEAEQTYRELPQAELAAYRALCAEQRAILSKHAGGHGDVQGLIAEIERELPHLVAELESRHPELAKHESALEQHGGTHQSLDEQLREAEERLRHMSIITDPETLDLKAAAAREAAEMQQLEAVHEAVSPCFDLLRRRGENVGSLVSAFDEVRKLSEGLSEAEDEHAQELGKVDAAAVKVRTELLVDQFEDEMMVSPWLTRKQSFQQAVQQRSPSANSSPMGSPTSAAAAGRSASVGLAGSGSSSPSSRIDNFFSSAMAANSQPALAAVNGRSASVGILGTKAPPPPPPIYDKNGKQVRYPAVGKKIIPPPPPSAEGSKKIAPALMKFLHFAPNVDPSASGTFDASGRSASATFNPPPRLPIPKAPPPPPSRSGGDGRSGSAVNYSPMKAPPPPPPPGNRSGSVSTSLNFGSSSGSSSPYPSGSPETSPARPPFMKAPPPPPPPGTGSVTAKRMAKQPPVTRPNLSRSGSLRFEDPCASTMTGGSPTGGGGSGANSFDVQEVGSPSEKRDSSPDVRTVG